MGSRYRLLIKKIANFITPIEVSLNIVKWNKWERKNKLLRLSKINIGKNVAIDRGFESLLGKEESLFIGDFVAIGHNMKIYNFEKVNIGSYSTIAAEVTMNNGWHDSVTLEPDAGTISIGKGCWIGHGVNIVGSVTIGNNAIIGAGSLVINDIPNNAIAVGVPAKVIKIREVSEQTWHYGDLFFNAKDFNLLDVEHQDPATKPLSIQLAEKEQMIQEKEQAIQEKEQMIELLKKVCNEREELINKISKKKKWFK